AGIPDDLVTGVQTCALPISILQIKKTLELDPASTLARHLLGCCLLWKGDTAGAIAKFQRSKIMVTGAWYQGLLGYAYAISGDRRSEERRGRKERSTCVRVCW